MRPVDDAAAGVVLVFALDQDALAHGERDRTGKIGVRFYAYDESAAGIESKQKAFVRTSAAGLDAENARDPALRDDLDAGALRGVCRTDCGIVGSLRRCAGAERSKDQRDQRRAAAIHRRR